MTQLLMCFDFLAELDLSVFLSAVVFVPDFCTVPLLYLPVLHRLLHADNHPSITCMKWFLSGFQCVPPSLTWGTGIDLLKEKLCNGSEIAIVMTCHLSRTNVNDKVEKKDCLVLCGQYSFSLKYRKKKTLPPKGSFFQPVIFSQATYSYVLKIDPQNVSQSVFLTRKENIWKITIDDFTVFVFDKKLPEVLFDKLIE